MANVQSNYEHENDDDDVVEEFSDMGQDAPTARGSAVERINSISNQEKFYTFAQHDLLANDPENVQIRYEHENDVDDIPDTNDPMELNQVSLAKHQRGQPFKTVKELL